MLDCIHECEHEKLEDHAWHLDTEEETNDELKGKELVRGLTRRISLRGKERGFSGRGTKGLTPQEGSSNLRYFSIILGLYL